jgi:hypothetical protein
MTGPFRRSSHASSAAPVAAAANYPAHLRTCQAHAVQLAADEERRASRSLDMWVVVGFQIGAVTVGTLAPPSQRSRSALLERVLRPRKPRTTQGLGSVRRNTLP